MRDAIFRHAGVHSPRPGTNIMEFPRTLRPIAVAFGAALLLTAPLRAQDASLVAQPAITQPAASELSAPAGPTASSAVVAVRRAPAEPTAPAAPAAGNQGRGTALMIFGGAAILTGIVIGNGAGYAISVVGAVVGLYGLYQYLQ